MASDPTLRFSSRVDDYVAARPGYPSGVVEALQRDCGLGSGKTVADVGSGTGILTRDLLKTGATVFAVEPNAAMREAAEAAFGPLPPTPSPRRAPWRGGEFVSIDGTAEATGLPDASVDLVVAAQAFHWFDREGARREFARILRVPKRVALIWNERRETGSPFLEGYEALLREFGTDYLQVRHRAIARDDLDAWFGGGMRTATFGNEQRFDFGGLLRRLMSSSYAPKVGDATYAPMVAALRRLFDATQQDGLVALAYETNVHFGVLGSVP